ncbi:MAG: hypothetical protein WBM17_11785 [Anaerolineales bacterium]
MDGDEGEGIKMAGVEDVSGVGIGFTAQAVKKTRKAVSAIQKDFIPDSIFLSMTDCTMRNPGATKPYGNGGYRSTGGS